MQQAGLLLVLLGASAVSYAKQSFDPTKTDVEQRLLDWAAAEGAELLVTIGRNPNGVRGLFTTRDVRKGETLIGVPKHIFLSVKDVGAAETAPALLKELSLRSSRLRPYLDALPDDNEVLSGYNWPDEYIKYLADGYLEEQVESNFHGHVFDVLSGVHNENMEMTIPEAMGLANITDITEQHYRYITTLISTRTFSLRTNALSMVPIADMVNHDSRGINHVGFDSMSNFRMIAGKDLEEGEEVTITYGAMRPDELLLYYGFLEEHDGRLLVIDHHKFVPYESDSESLGEDPFTGTPEEIEAEIMRLNGRLATFEERVAAVGPVPEHNPYMAFVINGLRDKRVSSIRAEVARLTHLLANGGGAVETPKAEL